jgi:hypothetical protein
MSRTLDSPAWTGLDAESHVLLVQEKINPSTDYYLMPRIRAAATPFRVLTGAEMPAVTELDNACVIFVRYIPPAWIALLQGRRKNIARVIYFMDDDLFDFSATQKMRWRYRWHLVKNAARHQAFLKKIKADIWVSNRHLQQKYSAWSPVWIEPLPLVAVTEPSVSICVFYHGSVITHKAEIEWLFPIMKAVLEQDTHIRFEVVGDATVNRLLKQLPRTMILHSMSWQNYQSFCRDTKRDIGLAPLLPGSFNQARSHTKYFDIARCGAAGIYSRVEPFAGFVRDSVDGLLLDDDPQQWIAAILQLAGEPDRCKALHHNAVERIEQLALQSASTVHPFRD